MVHINPGDLPALPVEQLAQYLLGCARADPTLLARSNSGPILRRDANIRVPVGRPADTTVTPIDLASTPIDARARPVVRRPEETPASPIEALATQGNPATPLEATELPCDPTARPVEALEGPVDSTPRPNVPSFGWIDSPPVPIEALTGPADSTPRPIVPSFGRTDRPIAPIEALTGPVDSTPRPIVPSFGRIDSPTPPIEALAGPVDRSARPIVPSFSRLAATSDAVDQTARLAAQRLQLRRSDGRDDPELEELVSIAVACARRAEDALQQAREISWMARRRMSVVAAVTGAGVLAASGVGILDRYHAIGEHHLPTIASAVITGAPIAAPVLPAGPAPAPAEVASSSGGSTSAPTRPAPVLDALAVPPPAGLARPVPVAAAVPSPHEPSAPVPVAAVVPPPVRQAESTPGINVGPGGSPATSVNPVAPAASIAQAGLPAPDGNSSGGVPAGQSGVVSASLDVAPVPPAAQVSHPFRHVRRASHHVTYYVSVRGVLLAQVVYGVRRIIYEIFH